MADPDGAGVIGYILDFFPQLSETFIENELRVLGEMGVGVVAFSMYRPAPALVGPTSFDPARLHYRPSSATLARHFVRWALRRPGPTAVNVGRALRLRSLTMLRGAWSAAWVASGSRAAGVRHVHAHFAHDAACTGLAAAGLLGVPFTFTAHAHDIYLRTNGLALRCERADRVVTVCEYNVEQLRAQCPTLRRDHIEIVYCGVDPSAFSCADVPAGRSGPAQLLSVGRLVDTKGFPDLVRALGLLRDRGRDVVCDIVGQGPQQQHLEHLVAELDLADVITLTGPRPPRDIAARMRDADIFVLACRIDAEGNRDSMPVVIKEAMASCVPVVSTSEVGIPEMVDDEVGRLAPPNDPVALADAIDELLALTPDERRAMGERGRRRVEARFNVYTETAALRALFDRLAVARS